jgi:hypothetical protein
MSDVQSERFHMIEQTTKQEPKELTVIDEGQLTTTTNEYLQTENAVQLSMVNSSILFRR